MILRCVFVRSEINLGNEYDRKHVSSLSAHRPERIFDLSRNRRRSAVTITAAMRLLYNLNTDFECAFAIASEERRRTVVIAANARCCSKNAPVIYPRVLFACFFSIKLTLVFNFHLLSK